jgi:hypothetical protein
VSLHGVSFVCHIFVNAFACKVHQVSRTRGLTTGKRFSTVVVKGTSTSDVLLLLKNRIWSYAGVEDGVANP